jgi:drug/metabolite transporter (DMT)-like permease
VLVNVVDAFGWAAAVSLRCFVAGFSLLILARLTGRALNFAGGWRPYVFVGATTVAGQLIGLSYGTPKIGTAMAAILVAAIPLFSMVISAAWGIERLTLRTAAGLACGFLGIVMLVGFPAAPVTPAFIAGCAATLFASFCAALGSNFATRHLRQAGPWESTAGAFLFGGAMSLPLLLVNPVPGVPQPVDYLYLFILGAGMSALTYVQYFRLVSSIGATRAISVEFVVTLVAVSIGALVLGEKLSALQLAGGAAILIGCAIVLGLLRAPRLQRRPA